MADETGLDFSNQISSLESKISRYFWKVSSLIPLFENVFVCTS